MSIIDKIFGDPNQKYIKTLQPKIDKINELEDKYKVLSDEELGKTKENFKEILSSDQKNLDLENKLEKILPDVFAAIREASGRVLGQRHYDVQLVGGIILHLGKIAEMKTGEGKTLVATLPIFLNALAGKGVHLVTVNDYLSRIGAGWMAPVYYFLGMSIGVIVHDSALIYDPEYTDENQFDPRLKHFRPISRKEAYQCDITYGTNNEFGFDYLRDNMVQNMDDKVQKELHYAIVDEIDSILIDEARTPLIISAPAEESTDKYFKFFQLVKQLKENEDYNVDEKMRAVSLSESGINKMEKWLGVENIYVSGGVREVHHIEQALKAQVLFQKDKDYVVQEGQVIIVDEFTGRLMHGRRYSEGLHQAIEAKENLKVQRESQTFATITFQNLFRMYNKLGGMTGTAVTEAEEFAKIYNLETIIVPTHKPMVRKDLNDLIYRTEEGKFRAVINEVKERHKIGQPVLVGTISIEKNEILVNMMEREGLHPQILNAKNHEKEAQIISQAGQRGSTTIATNMAGRGVDIILGGSSAKSEEEQKKVKELGGLHVIGTERHESRRIDNQLRGRAGRQGDSGSSQFYVSMDDDLMRIFGGDRMKTMMQTLKVPEDMPIENKIISKSIEQAQKKVEGHNFDIRKHLVEYDDVINKHRGAIYKRRDQVLKIAQENELLKKENRSNQDKEKRLSEIILEMVENEIEQVVFFHTSSEIIREWNLNEIYQVASTIFPVKEKLKEDLDKYVEGHAKLDKAKARTAIIEHLSEMANNYYQEMIDGFKEMEIDFMEIEKNILLRSIDTLWVEHLEAMAHMRQGIGLRGYGQRDPLVEYKKEAYTIYNELNSQIQKQVVYSIFKVADVEKFASPAIFEKAKNFSAPSKTMDSKTSSFSGFKQADQGGGSDSRNNFDLVKPKVKNESGEKVGRNDPCPCGSGKKYKKCCGK